MRYTVLLAPGESEPVWVVTVPALPGCATQGDTVEEALDNAREAIAGHVAALRDLGRPVPVETTPPLLTAVDVDPAA